MAGESRVVINLSTGLEDAEQVTVAFLIGGAALEAGKQVAMFLTKEAVRLALPGHANAVACEGCPPLARLFQQFGEGGGELLVCPICFNSKKLRRTNLPWRVQAQSQSLRAALPARPRLSQQGTSSAL